MEKEGIDFLCAPGHKGLLGPQGTGILAVNSDVPVRPLMAGGTGSRSMDPKQPDFYPARLARGPLNVPGIVGLMQGVPCVNRQGMEQIARHEEELCAHMISRLMEMPHVTVYLPDLRKGPFSPLNMRGLDCEKVAALLDEKDIAVRSGLHCAPLAHKSMGTYDVGSVRVSPGWSSSLKEASAFVDAVWKMKKI
jgi:selenocysteine lyase/cysteine desulfurase